jgi:oligoribonuclease NrnB/cAMP/cGMP phosphodiesterase (DHH superfamily)
MEEIKFTHGIYHSADLDGIGSAAVMKLKHPLIKLIGYNYGQNIPDIPDGSSVIMSDVSFPIADMYNIGQRCKHFVWIDHHKSAIDDYTFFIEEQERKTRRWPIVTKLEIGRGACELTYEYLFKDTSRAIFLLGKYDTWRQETEKFQGITYTWHDALSFQMGMRLPNNNSVEGVMRAINLDGLDEVFMNGEFFVDEVIKLGATVLEYQKAQNERVAYHDSFVVDLLGYRALACNTDTFNSGLFDSVWDEKKHDVMIPFKMRRDGSWKFSCYTTKDDVDCSLIAKEFGGGGHQKAAGFKLGGLPW